MSTKVEKLQALLARVQANKDKPRRRVAMVLPEAGVVVATDDTAVAGDDLDELGLDAELPHEETAAAAPELQEAAEVAVAETDLDSDDGDFYEMTEDDLADVEVIDDLDELGIEIVDDETMADDAVEATGEAARAISEPPAVEALAADDLESAPRQVTPAPTAEARRDFTPPPESGEQAAAHGDEADELAIPEAAERSAPTVEQLGSTIELDDPLGPELELDKPAPEPAAASAAKPHKLEASLEAAAAPGHYDDSLAPPPEAKDELAARRSASQPDFSGQKAAAVAAAPTGPQVVGRPPVPGDQVEAFVAASREPLPTTFLELLDDALSL